MITATINNTTYESRPDNNDGCTHCVAQTNGQLCAKLQQTNGEYNYCSDHEVIWLKLLEIATNNIETSAGRLTSTTQASGTPCHGCAAELNRPLCREINNQTTCRDATLIWVQPQLKPDYSEVLDILQEECAEVIQAVSKVRRFGLEASHPNRTTTNKWELEEELGDLLAMIEILTSTGYLSQDNITLAKQAKTQKLKQYSKVWTNNSIG